MDTKSGQRTTRHAPATGPFGVLVLAGALAVAGQSTPTGQVAGACRVEPRPDDFLAHLEPGTASAAPFHAAGFESAAPVPVPHGAPADQVVVAGINATVDELVACDEAGDQGRFLALHTLDFFRRELPPERRPTDGKPARTVYGYMLVGDGDPAGGPWVEEATMRPDGRGAARMGETSYWVFARIRGRWLTEGWLSVGPEATPTP